ncbi:MAG: RnfABCDGE type electron transport complex subunit G [Candidatus Omnitrophica bacterium]|nr:RnfABCDGE type electron transport complex subunit G [Candidatus Omnitrophota bacterium]
MKEIIKIIVVLTLVCIICAFFLALVQGLAEKKIEFNAAKRIKDAISNLAPGYSDIEEIVVEEDVIYKLKDKSGKSIGYAFSAQGQGYQGKIKILAVANPSLNRLEGIEIVDSLETPGLGAKIQEEPFSGQFKGLNLGESIQCVKGASTDDDKVPAVSQATKVYSKSQIEAITGATVSSRAVVNILNERIKILHKQLKKDN